MSSRASEIEAARSVRPATVRGGREFAAAAVTCHRPPSNSLQAGAADSSAGSESASGGGRRRQRAEWWLPKPPEKRDPQKCPTRARREDQRSLDQRKQTEPTCHCEGTNRLARSCDGATRSRAAVIAAHDAPGGTAAAPAASAEAAGAGRASGSTSSNWQRGLPSGRSLARNDSN